MNRTVLDILTTPNPELGQIINEDDETNFGNTTGRFQAVHEIQPWEDFTGENIRNTFREFFSETISEPFPTKLSRRHRCVKDENDVDKIFDNWCCEVVDGVLDTALIYIQGALNIDLMQLEIGQKLSMLKKQTAKRDLCWKPDWTFLINRYHPQWYLLGDSKVFKKWQSQSIPLMVHKDDRTIVLQQGGKTDVEKSRGFTQALLPITQVVQYCIQAGIAHTFIVTSEELVKAIPWENSSTSSDADDDSALTVNLALYTLLLLSLKPEHRRIRYRSELGRYDIWADWRSLLDQAKWTDFNTSQQASFLHSREDLPVGDMPEKLKTGYRIMLPTDVAKESQARIESQATLLDPNLNTTTLPSFSKSARGQQTPPPDTPTVITRAFGKVNLNNPVNSRRKRKTEDAPKKTEPRSEDGPRATKVPRKSTRRKEDDDVQSVALRRSTRKTRGTAPGR
ncbi:hypothetical protein F4778DRAFT_793743 [Xylariomycetidae sp. FL2044]|nr:hypothetical protein F4778DRAFT_793743 [Xylariomycetidae sp. FL2044]